VVERRDVDFMACINVNIRALSGCDRIHPRLQVCPHGIEIVFSDSCDICVSFSVESVKCQYVSFI
jgi:hypothetical protein